MALNNFHPVANGLRTDHPIPDLPFVDDSHLPLDDPRAIEKIGRYDHDDMEGRTDRIRPDGGWLAYTTDPRRHDLAWLVRWHPEHGRSVVLYRQDDASSVYMTFWGPALLFRAGGYWWDGSAWYRPSQIFDRASEAYVRRPVPAAMTVHAADLLTETGTADPGATVLSIDDLDLDAPARPGRWQAALADWASRRPEGALPLQRCVVQFNAPELAAGQLLSLSGLAEVAGIGESTLRSYQSRGQGDVPAPQAVLPGGRALWSLPVAEEWAASRTHSPEGAAAAMTADSSDLTVGVSDLWDRFTRLFHMDLWERQSVRKRWALRFRTAPAVREVATTLGWTVAGNLEQIVPVGALADTLHYAVLDELATGKQLATDTGRGEQAGEHGFYGIQHGVAEMLGWLIRHDPYRATGVVNEIIGEAQRRMGIPRETVVNSLRTALALDGGGQEAQMRQFLERALAPE